MILRFSIRINSFKSSIVVSFVNLLYPGVLGVFRGPAHLSADPLIRSMCSPVPQPPSPPGSKFFGKEAGCIPVNHRVVIAIFLFSASSMRQDGSCSNASIIAAAFKTPALRKKFRSTNVLANITHSPFPSGKNWGIMTDPSLLFGLN